METKTITLTIEQWLLIDAALEFLGESNQDQIENAEMFDMDEEDLEELQQEIDNIDEIQNSIRKQSSK